MRAADHIKACCATAYSSDLVALLLGDSHHPGGRALTRRLADALALAPGARVLDVASGPGTTAMLLAREYGVRAEGLDLSEASVERARAAAEAAGLGERVGFTAGDAERLPFADASLDAALCECAFCTFPDKPGAAAELARVLRPGGRLGLADVTVVPERLPPELASLGAWIACVADARPLDEYAALLSQAGLRVLRSERHDAAIARTIEQIEARLAVLRIGLGAQALGPDAGRAGPILAAARGAVEDGAIGYGLLVAERPG